MASSKPKKISILLVSKTGNGKSSLANALLDKSEFQVGGGMASCTAQCERSSKHIKNRILTVVDTPGTMDVEDEEKAKTEIQRAIEFCPEGFDIFMVVVKCDTRFTAEEKRAIEVVAEIFGEAFYRHAIVVFSHGDEYDNDETAFRKELRVIRKKIPYLNQLLNRCGDRFVLVDNSRRCDKAVQDRQIGTLLSLADSLVTTNSGRKYTSAELEAEKKRAEAAERKKAEEAERKRAAEEADRRKLEAENAALKCLLQQPQQLQQQQQSNEQDLAGSLMQIGWAGVRALLSDTLSDNPRQAQNETRENSRYPPLNSYEYLQPVQPSSSAAAELNQLSHQIPFLSSSTPSAPWSTRGSYPNPFQLMADASSDQLRRLEPSGFPGRRLGSSSSTSRGLPSSIIFGNSSHLSGTVPVPGASPQTDLFEALSRQSGNNFLGGMGRHGPF